MLTEIDSAQQPRICVGGQMVVTLVVTMVVRIWRLNCGKARKVREMLYTTRSIRRRRGTDCWEVSLTHPDPVSGTLERTYHTVQARTLKQAEKARDELIVRLEIEGGAVGSSTTVRQYLDTYVDYKRNSGTIESSTANGYAISAKVVSRYIGDIRLCDLTIDDVNNFMARMTKVGYAPKSVGKPFRLLKQALEHARVRPHQKEPLRLLQAAEEGEVESELA